MFTENINGAKAALVGKDHFFIFRKIENGEKILNFIGKFKHR